MPNMEYAQEKWADREHSARRVYIKGDRVITRYGNEYVSTRDEDWAWRMKQFKRNPRLPMPLPDKHRDFETA